MGKGSDLLGRPNGFQRIHVVDSSVLPSIAPGPITFTVMANAMRIAEESVK
jgi:choline dehydrogenase-like flavoprotein